MQINVLLRREGSEPKKQVFPPASRGGQIYPRGRISQEGFLLALPLVLVLDLRCFRSDRHSCPWRFSDERVQAPVFGGKRPGNSQTRTMADFGIRTRKRRLQQA